MSIVFFLEKELKSKVSRTLFRRNKSSRSTWVSMVKKQSDKIRLWRGVVEWGGYHQAHIAKSLLGIGDTERTIWLWGNLSSLKLFNTVQEPIRSTPFLGC
jgi:hypothetical protein